MSRLRRSVILLLLAGIVVHVCLLGAVHLRTGSITHFAFHSLDAKEYWQIARNLVSHGVFSQDEIAPFSADTWRTPGYPLVLAAVMSVTGDSPAVMIIFQQLLSILNVWLLFCIARAWMSNERALVVALLFLVEPYHLFYSLWLMATTLFLTVLFLTWLAWQRTIATGKLRWVIMLGLSCGFLVLVRPIAGLIPVALVAGLTLWALRMTRSQPRKQRTTFQWQALPVFATACMIVVGAWMTRNYKVSGHLELSDQGGVVLAYFKAAEVELWRQGRTEDRYLETSLSEERLNDPHPVWASIDQRLREKMIDLPDDVRKTLTWWNLAQGNKTEADSFEISEALRQIAVSDLSQSPLSTLSCCLVRCVSVLTFPLNLALRPPHGIDGTRTAWLFKSVPYVLLVFWVLVALFKKVPPFEQVFFPLVCVAALLLVTTPQLDPRFRVPMIPLLLLMAFLPASQSAKTVPSRQRRRLG